MKRNLAITMFATMMMTTAFASEAETSATAGSNSLRRSGTTAASARYDGRVGFARTDTRSGAVNTAQGVAVGVDRDGLSLSVSNAVAPRVGPALATNFNLTIGRDGSVSKSGGISVARSPLERSVSAGGNTASHYGRPVATSYATGRTDRFGRVDARTNARTHVVAVRPTTRSRYAVRRPAPRPVVRVAKVARFLKHH